MVSAAKSLEASKPIAEDGIILSVRLRSGGFESQIEVPIYSTRAEIDRFVAAWLEMMDAGIKIGRKP